MKKSVSFSMMVAGALAISACSGGDEAADAAGAEETIETAVTEECTEENMMAKATELGEKMQAMASDADAMQEMATKMQEIQQSVQEGSADGSFGVQEACAAYDELLEAAA